MTNYNVNNDQLSSNDYVFNDYPERYVLLEHAQQQLQQQLLNTCSNSYNSQVTVAQIY